MKDALLREISRCSFCGFCEAACPTRFMIKRNYTPRGRINTIIFALKNELTTIESVNGIFSCLECGACKPYCPAGIDIPRVIREFRHLVRVEEVGVLTQEVK